MRSPAASAAAVAAIALLALACAERVGDASQGSDPAAKRATGGHRRLVLLSIDGLPPSSYAAPDAHGLAVPNLRRLAREGAVAAGVEGVLPTVTYPSHTTLVTGVPPAMHGIYGNTILDPLGRANDAWYWYAGSIRVPTLASAVRARGRTVGSVFWPVTVGLAADWLVPEFWRTGSDDPADVELLRALSTPGLLDSVAAERGRPFTVPFPDEDRTDLALSILRRHRPDLLLLHLGNVDHEEHAFGPDSPEARRAIEAADRDLGRLRAALEEGGLADSTLLAVVSDHGFLGATKLVRLNTLLVENGLVELDAKGKVKSWRAWFHSHAGSASLHLADPGDAATRAKVVALLESKRREPGSGIGPILDRAAIASLGGDPRAELFVDAADGFLFSKTATGAWLGDSPDRGQHGYDPRRPELRASLLVAGPGVAAGRDLGVVPMTRIAPTLGKWLGVELDARAAEPLPLF